MLLRIARHSSGRCASCCRTSPDLRPALDDPRRPVPLRSPRAAHAAAGLGPCGSIAPPYCRRACKPEFQHGFVYSDCRVDDARLVVLNALDARRRGARVLRAPTAAAAGATAAAAGAVTLPTARRVERARRSSTPPARGSSDVLTSTLGRAQRATACGWSRAATSSCRGCYDGDHAYILQNADRRVVFVIPYEDRLHADRHDRRRRSTARIRAARADAESRLSLPRGRTATSPSRSRRRTCVWTYSGVRPLYDDGTTDPSAVTRDYALGSTTTPARRRCSRCSAARSPPIAASPSMRWRCWRRTFPG